MDIEHTHVLRTTLMDYVTAYKGVGGLFFWQQHAGNEEMTT